MALIILWGYTKLSLIFSDLQVSLFVSTKMTKMRASLFVPTPEMYSKTCTKWIGYESVVVPYFLHSLQWLLIRAIPNALVDFYMLRYFLYWRRRGLAKDSKIKALAASKSEVNIIHNETH